MHFLPLPGSSAWHLQFHEGTRGNLVPSCSSLIIEPRALGNDHINYGDQSESPLLRHSATIRSNPDAVFALFVMNRELATLDSRRGDSNAGTFPLCLIINANLLYV